LHLIISSYLRKSKEGIQWGVDRLVSWANDLFKKDIAFSQSINSNWEVPKEKYPPAALSEFYYSDPDAVEKCLSSISRLTAALKSFMTNPLYSEFRLKGIQPESIIEGFIKLHTVTPCKIDGRVDLAYKDDSTIRVVDWKLGNEDGIGDDSLQLAAYGLWAVETMKYSPESIRVCKVHFGSEAIVNFDCNSQVLSTARARIMQDAERMAFLEDYGKNACIEAFTPCAQESLCRQCAYLGICGEGKEVIYA
ncbi:MAG: PD-(D/E)XK nuclease family protein, partial [Candidatus Methanofastidiosa archaeon]|nr:PD-(D/E)XK nuclease family protein [Candidatus Methanofastidiosa archaeon]